MRPSPSSSLFEVRVRSFCRCNSCVCLFPTHAPHKFSSFTLSLPQTHARTRSDTHKRIHILGTDTDTHTHTHTHTHTRIYWSSICNAAVADNTHTHTRTRTHTVIAHGKHRATHSNMASWVNWHRCQSDTYWTGTASKETTPKWLVPQSPPLAPRPPSPHPPTPSTRYCHISPPHPCLYTSRLSDGFLSYMLGQQLWSKVVGKFSVHCTMTTD